MSSENITARLYRQFGHMTLSERDRQLFNELVANDFNGETTFTDYENNDPAYSRKADE